MAGVTREQVDHGRIVLPSSKNTLLRAARLTNGKVVKAGTVVLLLIDYRTHEFLVRPPGRPCWSLVDPAVAVVVGSHPMLPADVRYGRPHRQGRDLIGTSWARGPAGALCGYS